jgi:hypothetical protein
MDSPIVDLRAMRRAGKVRDRAAADRLVRLGDPADTSFFLDGGEVEPLKSGTRFAVPRRAGGSPARPTSASAPPSTTGAASAPAPSWWRPASGNAACRSTGSNTSKARSSSPASGAM